MWSYRRLRAQPRRDELEKDVEIAVKLGAVPIRPEDEEFPPLLKSYHVEKIHPPRLLFRVGERLGDRCYIAVVGTRRPSPRGEKLARTLGEELARAGYSVVTGGASGVDTYAWEGARGAGGHVVVVAPFLFEKRQQEKRLWRQIKEGETLVSEFLYPPYERAVGQLLAIRNRVIAGISAAVIIPETRCEVAGGRCREEGWGTRYQVDFGVRAGRLVVVIEPEKGDQEAQAAYRYFVEAGATPAKDATEALKLAAEEAAKRCGRQPSCSPA